MTASYLPGMTIVDALRYDQAQEVVLVGKEDIQGIPTWHVSVLDGYNQEHHYWIEDAPLFPVYHYEYRYDHLRRTCVSQYGEHPVTSALPRSIQVRSFRGEALHYERLIEVVDAKFDVPVDPDAFTLGGLEMAIGTPVTDLRIKTRLGYWDGTRPIDAPPRVGQEVGMDQRQLSIRPVTLAALLIVTVLVVVVLLRVRRST